MLEAWGDGQMLEAGADARGRGRCKRQGEMQEAGADARGRGRC